jgi:hypothetical protein
MKKSIVALLAVAATLGVVSAANANNKQVRGPLYECALSFDAKGGGVQIFVGHFELNGPGTISCVDINGRTSVQKVNVKLGGEPLALRIAAGHLCLRGIATGIGLFSGGPASLLGTYIAAQADAAIGIGAGASVSIHANNGITFNLNLALAGGVGLNAGISSVEITAAEAAAAPAPTPTPAPTPAPTPNA